ncbi:MAG: SHIRT domain-containing protein, partial [Actinomycetaceae bacterium]|nr:SHIRT domain-containing protein [Actinomycetaceae bacterium]
MQNNYTALIEGSTFQNMAADENGGAITVTTRVGHSGGGVNLTLRDTTITNTRTRFAWANQAGGAIYNGSGNTLTIEGGSINGCFAPLGGGIFNDGTLILDKGVVLDNNTTYKLGGGIYNNGTLTVANATLRNNRHAEGKPFPGKSAPNEHVGGNIYAKKDVVIKPEATFDANDVRVLDKESAVVLTGALTKQLNVTISEKALPSNTVYQNETQVRKVGYLVAKGDGTYQPTAADAKIIHYLTNNTDPAEVGDHTSLGKWDYVLTPDKTIVLGQRAKVVYNPNAGAFAGVTGNLVEDYVVFAPDKAYRVGTDTAVSKLPVTDQEPTRDGFAFRGWYVPAGPHAGLDNTVATEPAFVMPNFFGGDAFDGTTILDPNTLTANAVWGKAWKVTYEFKSAQADKTLPSEVTKLLPPAKTDLVHGSDVPAVAATFPEVPVTGGKWVFTGWNADTAVKAIDGNHTFTGTWQFVPATWKVTYEFKSAQADKTLP